MIRVVESRSLDDLLADQIAYYRALAPEYDAGGLELPGGEEIDAALADFRADGDGLELACGTGGWTLKLLRHADSITAVAAAPEMLEVARARVGQDPRVRFVEADVFAWEPDRRYDVVFFGFWLSHVPRERFAGFWSVVDRALAPDGRVFFADDGYRTPEELVEGEDSIAIRRRLGDGSAFRAVKVPYTPAELEPALAELGWRFEVHQTAGPFFWGSGGRAGERR